MATITSAGSGLASATTTWVGGIVPVEGNKVIIAAGHVVELDGTFTWGDDSVTTTIPNAAVNVSGTLKASRTVNSSLTGKGLILVNYNGAIDYGTDASPISSSITSTLILNKATTPANREGLRQVVPTTSGQSISWSFVGDNSRSRGETIASTAASGQANVVLGSSSHGWLAGDEVLLFPTTNNATVDEYEFKTISSVSGATITFTTNLSYSHLAGSPACNCSSNVTIKSHNSTGKGRITSAFSSGVAISLPSTYTYKNVRFETLGGGTGLASGYITYESSPTVALFGTVVDSCAFIAPGVAAGEVAVSGSGARKKLTLTNCIVFAKGLCYGSSNVTADDSWFCTTMYCDNNVSSSFLTHNRNWVSIVNSGVDSFSARHNFDSFTISGKGYAPGFYNVSDSDIGYTFGWKSTQAAKVFFNPPLYAINNSKIENCLLHSDFTVPESPTDWNGKVDNSSWLSYVNKGQLSTSQEIYYGAGNVFRENAETNRSASSISIKPLVTSYDLEREQTIPCANGKTVRIVGYVKMDTAFWNAGNNNLPTVTISGLGITPVVFTASAAANNAWEQFDLSATNTAGYDGNLTLTYTANAKVVTTGTVYFDGVPDAPFVTQCRHYGFDLTQETSPTRTVDPYVVATEATAAALTGITIDGTAKTIAFGAGTGDTAQEFYDYTRAWACLNLSKDIPLNRAGTLYSLAAGWTVIDPVLTGLTWGGETIQWNSVGAKTGSFSGNTFDFTAAGSYDFAASTFSGTVEFVNTSGGAVVVDVPAGTSYTNTGPNITVNVAVDQAEASIVGIVVGSRLQIYNVTTATEMVNAINATSSYTLSYPDGTGYSAGDVVRVRLAWVSGASAKLPVEYSTISTAAGWSVLANQQDDAVYNFNAIAGSTCTEFIADYPNVQIDIDDPDGVTTPQRGYAWYIDGQMTADGLRYYHGAITAEDELNYRINVTVADMFIQNISASPVRVINARIYRSDGATVIVAGGGGVQMEYGRTYGLETGVSGLTVSESNKLLSLDTNSVNVTKMNGATVYGSGVQSDQWRGSV